MHNVERNTKKRVTPVDVSDIMAAHGLTLVGVTKLMGVSISTFGLYVHRGWFSDIAVLRLCTCLGIPPPTENQKTESHTSAQYEANLETAGLL